jgi:dipeptide/tripeptide permease
MSVTPTAAPAPAPAKAALLQQISGLPANFWYANIMEMFERLAFFGVRAIAPLYLVAASSDNGLALDYKEKGIIYTVWALLQCLIPMVSGGYTDRYGYRKSLAVAFTINIGGYLLMARSRPIADGLAAHGWAGGGFWVFMLAACLVATGTAIFKPPVQGTVARSTSERTSSLGWGLFYWVVNIGGALAPMLAAILRAEIDWQLVFYGAAIVTLLNFLPAFILYREPERIAATSDEKQGPFAVFASSIMNIFKDLRLVVFLLIFACFWLMFMQLWDLLPNFIDEWVNSSDAAGIFGWIREDWVLRTGQVKPEMIINIDAISIIVLVIPISWMISRMHKVAAMIIGMLISLVAFVGAGATSIGWMCCLMIFIFSIGEMICSPTFSAYIGLIAPKDKKALYMGYSNIPFAIGWATGNLIGGYFYQDYGARSTLALKYMAPRTELVAQAAQAVDWSGQLEKLPPLLGLERDSALDEAAAKLGQTPDAAPATLRAAFATDRGQIDNLALVYLALHSKDPDGLRAKLGKAMTEAKKADEAEEADEAREADDEAKAMGEALTRSEKDLSQARLARFVQFLPGALGKKRGDALLAVRELMKEGHPSTERLDSSTAVRQLWNELGADSDVLNDLALEYLAQGTGEIRSAVAGLQFKSSPDELKERMEEVTKRVGIDSDQAYEALGAALGAETVSAANTATPQSPDQIYVRLAQDARVRSAAITRRKWSVDQTFLYELISSDPKALEIVKKHVNEQGWFSRMLNAIRGSSAGSEEPLIRDGVNYRKLAEQNELIQKALAAKDWQHQPEQAAGLLQMNPYEARWVLSADLDKAKGLLWETYHPFMVWVYLGAFGVAGTVGMIIFYALTSTQTGGAQLAAQSAP